MPCCTNSTKGRSTSADDTRPLRRRDVDAAAVRLVDVASRRRAPRRARRTYRRGRGGGRGDGGGGNERVVVGARAVDACHDARDSWRDPVERRPPSAAETQRT